MAARSNVMVCAMGFGFMLTLASSSGCGGTSSGESASGGTSSGSGGSAAGGVLLSGSGGKGALGTGGGGQAPAEAGTRVYIGAIPGQPCLRQGLASLGNPPPTNSRAEGTPVKDGVEGAVVKCTITGSAPSYSFSVTAGAASSSVYLNGTVTNGEGTIPPRNAVFTSQAAGTQLNVEPCTIRTISSAGAGENLRIGAGEMFAEINCASIHDEGDPATTNCNALNVLVLMKNCEK